MMHPEIDEHEIVEHYVAGKLTADDEARFEEHYLDCPSCIRAIEDAERLRRGLKLAAAQDLVARQTILATALRVLRSGPGALLATALLLVVLLPAGLAWRRAGHLSAELDAARTELADELRPRINTPILALVPTRAGKQPRQRVSLAAEPEWIVIAVELDDPVEPLYEAVLTRVGDTEADETVVWKSSGLEPSYLGTVTLSFHSSLLTPGEYVLSLVGEERSLRFPLQVVPLAP